MKRGLLDRIDRCRHVTVCHAHADGVAGLKGLGARSHPIIAVRDGIATGKHLKRRQGIERGCRTAQVGRGFAEHRTSLMLQTGTRKRERMALAIEPRGACNQTFGQALKVGAECPD